MGKVTVVGIGPGNDDEMTPKATAAIRGAEVVVGYHTYLKLAESLLKRGEQEIIGTGMKQEIERAQAAVEAAAAGKSVAVVSGGDAGVYGMAGLILEQILKLTEDRRPLFETVAGISAVNAAAAALGAPLMHDYATISLSDLLTPWETIERRLRAAGLGDFVIALYNPQSHSRRENIKKAQYILQQYKSQYTPVGIVTDAGRPNEKKVIASLQDFTQEEITMSSLVIVGNSQTYVREGYMITPRGYENKEAAS
ncbi:MAG: precorrin-3B C(17)-methyltransferase [Selenomonadaceae bacterium]|nr:precorrin-3B C(17)-methyltransferase [Selenomonadaceae bacterium]